MPYKIRKQQSRFCVFKEGEDKPLGCHDTEVEAGVQIRALYASEKAVDLVAYGGALKAIDDTGKVGGYAVLFSDASRKDLGGDYFTPATDTMWEGAETRPALYHHGMDRTMQGAIVGNGWNKARVDDVGVWVEEQLDLRDQYEKAIFGLAKAGKLGLSSGTAGHIIQREPDGKLVRWPIVEISFTPTPAEPRTAVTPLKSVDITNIGMEVKAMNLIELIKKLVPGLSDEQYAQLEAVLNLAGMTGAAPSEPPMDEEMIKAKVLETVKALMPAQTPAPAAPIRPPYNFAPTTEQSDSKENAVKSLPFLVLGETPAAIKAVAHDLYGVDYEAKRYAQHQAFGRYMRYGDRGLTHEHQAALKTVILTPNQLKAFVFSGGELSALKTDMSEAIDTLGGFLVPEDVRLDMIERLPGLTAIRPGADVSPTSSDVMTKVTVTGGNDRHVGNVRMTWVGDTPSTGDAATNPTFGLEKTPVHISLATVRIPRALLEDSAFPITNKCSEWVADEAALDEDEQFLIGNGIAKPQGILPGSANGHALTEVNSGDADEITFSGASGTTGKGINALRYGIARQYRNGAVWMMNDSTAAIVSQMLDGTGRPLWQPSVTEAEPDRLLGYPVLTDEAMPDIAANAYPIIFGNRKGYQIADRIGMSVIRDETTHSEEDIVKLVFRRRLGGQVARTWMFAVMKVAV